MNMLIDTLSEVSQSPAAWISVLAVASMALLSAGRCAICPHVRGSAPLPPPSDQTRFDQAFVAGPSYLIAMVTGIVAMIAGLAMISSQIEPVAAFLLLAAGICIVQITPLQLRLREAYSRLFAASGDGEEAIEFARERLRSVHHVNIAMSVGLALMLAVGLLSF
ncbi:MAG: hypothetical protein AAF675_22100 [Pseudomonadota bacterium]